MKNRNLNIWCNNYFTAAQEKEKSLLLEGVGEHRFVLFDAKDNGASGESRDALLNADVAFGLPRAETVLSATRLRWLHVNSAGYTPYDRDDLKRNLRARGAAFTNSSDVFDEPCAQHLLAMMLALTRGLPFALDAQRVDKPWLLQELRPKLRLLNGQTALIFGFGAIGQRLAELLQPFEMNVVGVRRHPRGDEPARVVTEAEADDLLPRADHVINILPLNPTTDNYFNAERLARINPTACFYNIGRGTTVDQTILIERLETGKLRAAYLDVTDPEPLPPEHPLWTTPNCFITPHIGGGLTNEKERQVEHFLENLRRFENGETLLNRIV